MWCHDPGPSTLPKGATVFIRINAAACIVAVLAPSAIAQSSNVRVRGTVESAEGSVLTVVTAMGEKLPITLAPDAKIMAIVKSSLSNVEPGAFVGRNNSKRMMWTAGTMGALYVVSLHSTLLLHFMHVR
jgi:hypothetical protein